MAATRLLLRSSRPLDRLLPPPSSSTSSSPSYVRTMRCLMKEGSDGKKWEPGESRRKPTVVVKASTATKENVITSEPRLRLGTDLGSLVRDVSNVVVIVVRQAVKRRKPSKLQLQRFIERAIIDCRFFTLFGVAGSLLGSVLCFVEGCFFVLESYFHYFHVLSQRSSDGHMVHLLIEALDMFLLGTSMLIFGMGLYTMFVGTRNIKQNSTFLTGSNFFGLFHMKTLPTWIQMESISQAKSKIGHAIVMILHVGMLEKFKTIPLISCLDLACFAGSVLVSSACMFLLSRLSPIRSTVSNT